MPSTSESSALLAELLAAGADDEALAEWLDAAWDLRAILPGPAGVIAEELDGPAWRAALKVARFGVTDALDRIRCWYRDPDRREDARERRAARRVRRRGR